MRLEELPREIQVIIAEYVAEASPSLQDLAALSCVSNRIRSICLHLLFRQIYVTWDRIDYLLDQVCGGDSKVSESSGPSTSSWKYLLRFVLGLNFSSSNLKGEWHSGHKLARLLERCPKCKSIGFISTGSSVWVKHLPILSQITHLRIRSTLAMDPESGKVCQFSPDDLARFPNLDCVELEGFQLIQAGGDTETDEGETEAEHELVKIEPKRARNNDQIKAAKLVLKNCRWDYPTNLQRLYQHPLSSLVFELDDCFVQYHFEQQFRDFLYNFAPNIASLQLHVSHKLKMELRLAATVPKTCTALRSLIIHGFEVSGHTLLDRLPKSLNHLTIDLTHQNNKDVTPLANALRESKRKTNRPHLHIQLIKSDKSVVNL